MKRQKFFKFNFKKNTNDYNFYVNSTNQNAYDGIINSNNSGIFLTGPKKSGKTSLGSIWMKKFDSIIYDKNFKTIINSKKNVLIDNLQNIDDEEQIFHIINYCYSYKLNFLIISNKEIDKINFRLKDLISRLKALDYFEISNPDDDMLLNILTKQFVDKQFVINSYEIFQYIIKHSNRSYLNMINIVNKLDTLSLEKKRQLTIPLIKEIL